MQTPFGGVCELLWFSTTSPVQRVLVAHGIRNCDRAKLGSSLLGRLRTPALRSVLSGAPRLLRRLWQSGACLITDEWEGVDQFFTPDSEILIAKGAEEVVAHLRGRNAEQASAIGQAMMNRALRDHSYQSRAQQVHTELEKLLRTTKARKPRRKVSATQTISPLAA